MKPDIKTTEVFYHNLGKLFYAIAFADKNVHIEEFKTLHDYVSKYWMDHDNAKDLFGNDVASLIKVVFKRVEFFEETSEDMYDAFVAFKNQQPYLFTIEVNRLILDTARAISFSYSGVDHSEFLIINKLETELNRL